MATGAPTVTWPQDSTCVKVDDSLELDFWARRFRVSRETLKHAVRTVGPKFKDVEHYLSSKR